MKKSKFNVNFGKVIKRYRQSKSWTLPKLAKKSKLSKATLSKLENGIGNPTIETLYKLGDALDASVSGLLTSAELL